MYKSSARMPLSDLTCDVVNGAIRRVAHANSHPSRRTRSEISTCAAYYSTPNYDVREACMISGHLDYKVLSHFNHSWFADEDEDFRRRLLASSRGNVYATSDAPSCAPQTRHVPKERPVLVGSSSRGRVTSDGKFPVEENLGGKSAHRRCQRLVVSTPERVTRSQLAALSSC